MLDKDNAQAVQWGERAIALAEALGDVETLVHALNNVGTAQRRAQNEQGRAKLERSLRLALERGWEDHAARAYTNLACVAVDHVRDYPRAARYLQEGITYCTEHELDTFGAYMRAYEALARLEQGAAALWAGIGCPYEQALALADGDASAKLSALSIFERLGAQPALALLRQQGRSLTPVQALAAGDEVSLPPPPEVQPPRLPPIHPPPDDLPPRSS